MVQAQHRIRRLTRYGMRRLRRGARMECCSLTLLLWSARFAAAFVVFCRFKNEWFTDSASVNKNQVYSITLSNARFATSADTNVYEYYQGQFFPIDCKLWDAPSEPGNQCGSVPHNRYFTYTIHTYTTYNSGQQFVFQSADDLWLFINGRLVTSAMQGTHGTAAATYTLKMGDVAGTLGLIPGSTYRADIFYAQRSATGTPVFQLQMPAAALCNALSYPFTEFQIGDTFSNPWSASNIKPTGSAIGQFRNIPGPIGADANSYNVFSLTTDTTPNLSGGTGWYSVGGVPRAIKFANGFETTFAWRGRPKGSISNKKCGGFAFVFQSASPTADGGEAGNLRYAGIEKSVAIEFDANQDVPLGDPAAPGDQHISVHSNYDAQNSAQESGPPPAGPRLGISTYDPALPFSFCNSTVQKARIQYLPGQVNQSAPAGTPAYGWIRVFMNDNLVPSAEAPVNSIELNAKLGTVAYVGFTSSIGTDTGGTVLQANIDLHWWKMVTVPTFPDLCSLEAIPTQSVAGQPSVLTLQARDACNNRIKVGGEAAQVTTLLKPTKGVNQATIGTSIVDNTGQPDPPGPGAGTYQITYTSTVATSHTIEVRFAGSMVVPSVNGAAFG